MSRTYSISRVQCCYVTDIYVIDIGYGHIAPKTASGRVATIIYATFGIPLTLLTIAHVGGYMAAVFRFTYKNLMCGLACRVCTCCRSHSENPRVVTGQTTPDSGDKFCSSEDAHYNFLHVESGDKGQGEVQGHSDGRGGSDQCCLVVLVSVY